MAISPQTSTIGIVGTGHMGSEVARLFINAGYQVLVNNRHKEKAQSVIKDGAQWVDTSAALAQQSDVILTLVGFPEEVEDPGQVAPARKGYETELFAVYRDATGAVIKRQLIAKSTYYPAPQRILRSPASTPTPSQELAPENQFQ